MEINILLSFRAHVMVFIVLACLLSFCSGRRDLFSKTNATPSPRKGGSTWKKIWSDEFDFFDPSKWEYQEEDGCKLGVCHWGNKEKVRLRFLSSSDVPLMGRLTTEEEASPQHTRGIRFDTMIAMFTLSVFSSAVMVYTFKYCLP